MRQTVYKHISRTYFDIYNALTNAYKTKSDWLFIQIGAMFEFISEIMNRIAQDILYPVTRESAYAFADRCDYDPIEADGATSTVTITLTQAKVKTLLAGYRVGGINPSTGELVIYELTANASSGGTDTITAATKQKKTFTDINIGNIEKSEEWYEMPIDGYTKIITSSVVLDIDSEAWTRVDNFDASISTDRHFVLVYQSDSKVRILFGNGTTGRIPDINDTVLATFETTNGLSGRLSAGEIDQNVDNDSDISVVANAADVVSGNNAESVQSIIRNSRANVRTKNIAWSEEDLELLSRQADASVVKAKGYPGIGTAIIDIIPSGGGAPSTQLKADVKAYVQARTQFGNMLVTVNDPTYDAYAITADITTRAGFTANTVRDLTEFALTLVSSAIDVQVLEHYTDEGIDSCRTDVINVIWGWAFTSDENEALEFIVNQWQKQLGARDSRDWGQVLEVGDLWIMGDSLYDYGVDNFDLTAPTTNQTPASDEIINNTSSTVTVV